MTQIALIGAGQLGSRHLQALALLDRPAVVTVVDPSEASLATARERFAQVSGARHRVEVRYVEAFSALPAEIDAVVVATSANVRRAAIEQLLARSRVRYALVEKVLFQKAEDYAAVGELLERAGTRAWVNCAQRLWPVFQLLRSRTLGRSDVAVRVSGANWGLGCNAIHNIDLLPFLTGDRSCRLQAELDPGTVPSKRAGFVEFTGTLSAFGAGNNRVVQTSSREGDAPFTFEVQSGEFHAVWRVGDPTMRLAEAGGAWREAPAALAYQSQLTQGVLASLLDSGECVLPTYAESAAMHLPMLALLLEHLNRGARSKTDVCPIT